MALGVRPEVGEGEMLGDVDGDGGLVIRVASRAGGTIGHKRTQPEPTAIAPPTSNAAMRMAAASSLTFVRPPLMWLERGSAPVMALRRPGRTATTRPVGAAAPSASRRRSTSF